ncbi:MAG: hypothetical protein NC305_18700, partial [Lachnospiraceae bacterium]|nr:hypothetical protein [Lachnospiraceae bacterium]
SDERKIEGKLDSLESEIRSLRRALSGSVGNREGLMNSLDRLADNVSRHGKDMKSMRSALTKVKNNYEKTERRICGYRDDHPITLDDVWEAITTVGKGLSISALVGPLAGLGSLIGEIVRDEDWEQKNVFSKIKHEFDIKKKDLVDDHYEYDKENGKWVKKEKDDRKKTEEEKAKLKKKELMESITLWSGSLSREGSLLHFGKDGDVETDWGNSTYSADVMKAEEKLSAYVGLGGIGCEAGIALTALTGTVGGQLGSDNLGAHASAQIDVGKVEASAGAKLGYYDENGDFNPQMGVSAKGEAILAEVSGKAGLDIAGAEVNVKGSVNFGIGAHADIGFQDGKFRFDVGASLGVGGSVSFEVDATGLINNVVEHAQEIGDAAKDVWDATTDFMSNTANAVGEGIKEGFNTFVGLFGW